ncbi:hypothetical protein DM52_2854 [Burkholderia mallei]|nr:hypothetical protein DM52_2854 [Burkholderia mallei]
MQGLSIDARMPKHIGRLSAYRAYRVNEANEANKAGAAPASQAHAGRRTARRRRIARCGGERLDTPIGRTAVVPALVFRRFSHERRLYARKLAVDRSVLDAFQLKRALQRRRGRDGLRLVVPRRDADSLAEMVDARQRACFPCRVLAVRDPVPRQKIVLDTGHDLVVLVDEIAGQVRRRRNAAEAGVSHQVQIMGDPLGPFGGGLDSQNGRIVAIPALDERADRRFLGEHFALLAFRWSMREPTADVASLRLRSIRASFECRAASTAGFDVARKSAFGCPIARRCAPSAFGAAIVRQKAV